MSKPKIPFLFSLCHYISSIAPQPYTSAYNLSHQSLHACAMHACALNETVGIGKQTIAVS